MDLQNVRSTESHGKPLVLINNLEFCGSDTSLAIQVAALKMRQSMNREHKIATFMIGVATAVLMYTTSARKTGFIF